MGRHFESARDLDRPARRSPPAHGRAVARSGAGRLQGLVVGDLTVSVVIPCYNAARWIGETLASVLEQPGRPDVIVVDDGSTDDSVAVIERLAGDRVRLLTQRHAGVSRARNIGTAAALGDWLQYLDADDLLCPGSLAERQAVLAATGADVAYCDWVKWVPGPGGFEAGETIAATLGPRADVELIGPRWWPPGALLYRRALVDRIGPWREDLPVIQDARFLQDAAIHGARFAHAPHVGLRYRLHGAESLSRRDPRAFNDDRFRNAAQLLAGFRAEGTLDEARRQVLARVFADVA